MKTGSAEWQQQDVTVETSANWSVSNGMRQAVIYPAALILLSAGINYYFIYYTSFNIDNANLLYGAAFLLMGLGHILIFPKWLGELWDRSYLHGTIYTISMALVMSITPLLFFFTDMSQVTVFALVSSCAFLLPYALHSAVYYVRNIGAKEYQPWFIPADVEPDMRKSLMLNSIHFKFKISIHGNDPKATLFVVTLSPKLKLSAVFLRFLYDRHDVIELADTNGYPYGWLFSVKRRMGKHMLDPDLTLTENGVRESDIIIAERVMEYNETN